MLQPLHEVRGARPPVKEQRPARLSNGCRLLTGAIGVCGVGVVLCLLGVEGEPSAWCSERGGSYDLPWSEVKQVLQQGLVQLWSAGALW